jgi:hypothetical protein
MGGMHGGAPHASVGAAAVPNAFWHVSSSDMDGTPSQASTTITTTAMARRKTMASALLFIFLISSSRMSLFFFLFFPSFCFFCCGEFADVCTGKMEVYIVRLVRI